MTALRKLTEDPQLRALAEEYEAAPSGDQERVLEAFIEKARATYPDWKRTIERSERDGVILRAMFIHCLKAALARPDLGELQRFKAKAEEANFKAEFEAFLEAPPLLREGAFRLALAAQSMALEAGLDPNEAERLRRRTLVETGREGGTKSGEVRKAQRTWVPRAKKLARGADPKLSNEKIATEIIDRWTPNKTRCPGYRTLTKFISELRADGTLQQRRGSIPN